MRRAAVVLWVLSGFALPASAQPACRAQSGPRIVPLVELYTSEGCSSCPPADRWLSTQAGSSMRVANFLEFHVDYWDEIGWHDRFGAPAHSRRQRQRVAAAEGGDTVYTPQVMVGGDVRVAWSDPHKFAIALQSGAGDAKAALALRLEPAAASRWKAVVSGSATTAGTGASLWLAQALDARTTDVHAGENKGVALHHDRVVGRLWGPWPLTGTGIRTQVVQVPSAAMPWGLVAFVQDPRGRVLQSLALPASRCTAK